MLFGTGRAAFLEFLRNLTPQILLFTIALVMSSRLDLTHFSFTWDDFWRAMPLIAVIFTFFAAAVANMSLFIEKAATSVEWMNQKSIELQNSGKKGLGWTLALLGEVWKGNKKFFAEILLVFLVIQVGLSAVLISAIPAAANVIHQLGTK